MLGEFFWILAGGAVLTKKLFDASSEQASDAANNAWLRSVTDGELEEKLWKDICDPTKYEEIWTRIENHKKNGGILSDEPNFESVGTRRLRFCDQYGYPSAKLQGAREVGLSLLIKTYGKLPRSEAYVRVATGKLWYGKLHP